MLDVARKTYFFLVQHHRRLQSCTAVLAHSDRIVVHRRQERARVRFHEPVVPLERLVRLVALIFLGLCLCQVLKALVQVVRHLAFQLFHVPHIVASVVIRISQKFVSWTLLVYAQRRFGKASMGLDQVSTQNFPDSGVQLQVIDVLSDESRQLPLLRKQF